MCIVSQFHFQLVRSRSTLYPLARKENGIKIETFLIGVVIEMVAVGNEFQYLGLLITPARGEGVKTELTAEMSRNLPSNGYCEKIRQPILLS